MDAWLTILISVLGSSAAFGFIQFLVSRHDKKSDQQGEILKQISSVSERLDEQGARIARSNILRFDDELISGEHHSREYFRSILDDIDGYEAYCKAHSGFRNSFTTEAAAHIRKVYNRLLDNGEFAPKETS